MLRCEITQPPREVYITDNNLSSEAVDSDYNSRPSSLDIGRCATDSSICSTIKDDKVRSEVIVEDDRIVVNSNDESTIDHKVQSEFSIVDISTNPDNKKTNKSARVGTLGLGHCRSQTWRLVPWPIRIVWYYFRVTLSLIYVILMIYAAPFLLYWYEIDLDVMPIPYWVSVGSIVFTNLIITVELILAVIWKLLKIRHDVNPKPKSMPRRNTSDTNRTSVDNKSADNKCGSMDDAKTRKVLCLFAAYLPNEINGLEGPIRSMISMELPINVELEVLVVHNGGSQEDLNQLVRLIDRMRESIPDHVTLNQVHATQSKSKAENINVAVEYAMQQKPPPKYIGIFDADHHPDQDNLERALKTFKATRADIIQGRNCIGSGSRLISIEFDVMYSLYHPGGSVLRGFAIFGGSNGYWKLDVLNRIRMNPTMLTEDIDSSMRALRNQYKIIYNSRMISYEEAPPTFRDLIRQRLRWAQGWSEVTLYHGFPLIFGTGFSNSNIFKNLQRRIGVFLLLIWREFYYYLAAQALPIGVVALIKCDGSDCVQIALIIMTVIMVIFPLLNVIAVIFTGGKYYHPDLTWKDYLIYTAISAPYEWFKFHLSVLGHARNMLRLTRWRVTRRSTTPPEVGTIRSGIEYELNSEAY